MPITNPVLQAIADRRSIRGYTSDPISKEQIDVLLKAAVESPSARDAQPWHFTVVQNADLLDEINEEAIKNFGITDRMHIFYHANTCIFISADSSNSWGRLDCGIAAGIIALSAHSMGLGSVILGMPGGAFEGDKREHFEKLLKFPEGHAFAIAIAIGVPSATKEAHPIQPNKTAIVQ
ncbi:MAG: nitroreductase [Clostridiales bacterium]|nr:nitroreductase [Clostridiales bacterium]